MAGPDESVSEEPVVQQAAPRDRQNARSGPAPLGRATRHFRGSENVASGAASGESGDSSFTLTPEEMTAISTLNRNRRFNDPGFFCEAAFNTFCPIYE